MPRFNFNNITLQSKADITKIMENFNKIEENGRTSAEITEEINSIAAPKSHSSANTTYGIGTITEYGHCMIVDNLEESQFVNGKVLSAYQGKILNDAVNGINDSLGGMAKRGYSIGTTAPTGGNDGDVYDQYFD